LRRLALVTLCLFIVAGCGAQRRLSTADTHTAPATSTRTTVVAPRPAPKQKPKPKPRPAFAVGERVLTFVDHSRTVRFPGTAPQPRTLVTIIRYPAGVPGPFPLVIFGHGFNETPTPYSGLLEAWARAGYVVAAPVFPLENANAPGGPNENDLINQPRDMSFLITSLLALGRAQSGWLAGLIDPHQIAVTGQSDGGETALSVAYNRYFLDRRVRATVILSGAKIPGVGGFTFPAPSPPLLATQGTADTINPPSFTTAFYDVAPRPKYLLTLFGASHLGPYTGDELQQGIVARVSIAFLDYYLKGLGSPRQILRAGDVSGTSTVEGGP
jgi:dienelactone hydrolase